MLFKRKDSGRFEKVPNSPSNIKILSFILKKINEFIEEIFLTYRVWGGGRSLNRYPESVTEREIQFSHSPAPQNSRGPKRHRGYKKVSYSYSEFRRRRRRK